METYHKHGSRTKVFEPKLEIPFGYHNPVLLNEVLEFLGNSDGWIIDATLGDGGYDVEILKKGGRIIGLDVDPQALERAKSRFKNLGFSEDNFVLKQGNFRDLKELISQTDTENKKIKAIIFDLGVSSLQLDHPERGFSFGKDGPLDMRMDPNLGVTAADLVNTLTKEDLNELFQKLGEERLARRFAEAVVSARIKLGNDMGVGFRTTKQLADVIEKAAGGKHGKIHPATRVFQALRIAVNDELHALQETLPQSVDLLDKNGNLLVISFHSLEDRIVKNQFKLWEKSGLGTVLIKKPLGANEEEIRKNPRSRSAKLRVFKKNAEIADNGFRKV
jgi:16S rRNA (cytosine1402-N4)-methyltransferase